MSKYETIGGQVTRGGTYMKIMDLLRELQDQYCVMSHLHNTEDNHMDKLLARGWLGMAEMTRLIQHKVTEMAQGKLQ